MVRAPQSRVRNGKPRDPNPARIAFKEWASVCDALLEGRQTIILRKGGISEGTAPGVFVPEHSEFWLYPTWVHQAEQGVRSDAARLGADSIDVRRGSVPIRALVRVDLIGLCRRASNRFPLLKNSTS